VCDPDKNLSFNGLTVEQRYQAALKQTTAVAKALMPFLVTLQPARAPDPQLQREAVDRGLAALQDLLKTLLLDELLAARIVHKFGPPPPVDAPNDAHNLRVIRELHVILDVLVGVAPLDSITAGQADLGRLEDNQEPLTLRRDSYVDRRRRDHTELADRAAAVLLVHYLAAKWQEETADLLKRLGVGTGFSAFEKWAAAVPLQERRLMTAAGELGRADKGLPLEQQALLSDLPRCLAVINRHEAERFPGLAELSDEDMVRKLFERVNRLGHFARSKQQRPPKRTAPAAHKPRKRMRKTLRK
jgi:hypothetical protein